MRDFDLLRECRRRSKVHEQMGTSTIYGGAEAGDFEDGGSARVTVSEVCRQNGLAPSVFYRWRAVAKSGSAVALKRDAQRVKPAGDADARHAAELV